MRESVEREGKQLAINIALNIRNTLWLPSYLEGSPFFTSVSPQVEGW